MTGVILVACDMLVVTPCIHNSYENFLENLYLNLIYYNIYIEVFVYYSISFKF